MFTGVLPDTRIPKPDNFKNADKCTLSFSKFGRVHFIVSEMKTCPFCRFKVPVMRRPHLRPLIDPSSGRYDAMADMNMEWTEWSIATQEWVPSSAQAYLGTGLHLRKSLVIMGAAGMGKTEIGKGFASEITEVHMGNFGNGSGAFGLVKGVEAAAALESAMHPRFVFIWDDVHARESRTKHTSLASFLKSLVGQDTAQQIVCRQGSREGLVRLLKQSVWIFTINDARIKDSGIIWDNLRCRLSICRPSSVGA